MGDSIVETSGNVPDTMFCTVPGHYVRELLANR